MKRSLFRALAISIIGASFVGVSGVASARGWDDGRAREIHRAERKIDELKVARDRAQDHHNWREVRRIDAAIEHERYIIRRDRRHDW